jgi:hypothetical protein
MSYPVKYLLPYRELKQQIQENPEFLNYYRKYDIFIGSDQSIKFILKKLKKSVDFG